MAMLGMEVWSCCTYGHVRYGGVVQRACCAYGHVRYGGVVLYLMAVYPIMVTLVMVI